MELLEQVQNILNGGIQIQKSDFSNLALSEKVGCILDKSFIPQFASVEKSLLSAENVIEKARPTGRNWGQLIPVKKMNAAGRMVTYWESPEDRNEGKMKGAQNLFDIDEYDKPASDTDYYGQMDKDVESYQIKPLIMKFNEFNPALAKRMEEKYKAYQWDRETRDLDLKLDFDTLDYMRKAKNEPDFAKEWQEEYNEKTDRTCKMLNHRKLAMARLRVGSRVTYNGHSGKITGFSRRGFPNVDFGGTVKTCFVEEIADIDALEKKLNARAA